ncbi:MAG: cofactor-independent phosphoglycerate mutase [bacterium]|nr:cofactor-independent phosphoglycerate mutase [bacterium]
MKAVIFLADGMADEPLKELNNMTPLEYANTPNMDKIANNGASGMFLSLPKEFPTSSDVANMSVLGFDLGKHYPGRGPIEAESQNIKLGKDDIAWRCNLIHTANNILIDYSAGHIENDISTKIMHDLQKEFGSEKVTFYPGVSYRNIMVLHGSEFSKDVTYHKPDDSQGISLDKLKYKSASNTLESEHTALFVQKLIKDTSAFLENHPLNKNVKSPANSIWLHSPGCKPALPRFSDLYNNKSGAIISAVDVIQGIGICSDMEVIKVPGATGFIDTNYEGKAEAAVNALKTHDFVYLHVEAIDECSHMGRLDLKLKAIEDFDTKIVGPVLKTFENDNNISFAVLPDHPVPLNLKKHTRTPVPVAVMSTAVKPDSIKTYSEKNALKGSLGLLKKDELMKLLLDLNS